MIIATAHRAVLAGHLRDELARHEQAMRIIARAGRGVPFTDHWYKAVLARHRHDESARRIRAALRGMGERV